MKKLLFIIALSVFTAGTFATERTDDVRKVSSYALKQFEQEYLSAKDVVWKISSEYVKANFSLDGKKMAALYNLQGDFLGTVEYITFEELPVKAKTDILNKFKNFTFTSALKIINRPADNENFNDVGTYWVDLSNSVKQIIVSVSPSQSVALHKSFAIQTTASN